MTLRTLGMLQWFGLLAGGVVWFAQHVLGFGITQAECNVGGMHWGIANDLWQGALMGATAAVIVAASLAAAVVIHATRTTSYESEPPLGRIRMLAVAALVATVIFLMIVLLDGFASIFNVECRQG
jgi:hypothetical protein